MNQLLSVQHLSKSFGGLEAVSDLSFNVAEGEILGIIGPNGAGKSTLLRLMAKIYPPSTGTLTVRGTVAPLIEMGAGFNPELSGNANILLNGAMLGTVFMVTLPELLRGYVNLQQIMFGAILFATMAFHPGGLIEAGRRLEPLFNGRRPSPAA